MLENMYVFILKHHIDRYSVCKLNFMNIYLYEKKTVETMKESEVM